MKKLSVAVLALMIVLSAIPLAGGAQEEALEIIWLGYGQSPEEGQALQRMLEDRFGVKFVFPSIDTFDADQINLFWASGGEADMINNSTGSAYCNMLVEQGLVRSYPVEWLDTYLPVWCQKAAGLVDGNLQTLIDQCTWGDALYSVPLIMANFMEPGIFLVRQDWLDNLGLETPTTLDAFHDMLYAFTYNDPDGNGKDDTYGMNGNGRYYFNYVFAAYGIMKNSYYLHKDGSVAYTSATDEYKEVMKLLADWYAEGIIDPETITDDRTKQREKWGQGLFGVLPDNASWCSTGFLQNLVLDNNPDAKIAYMPAFEGYGSFVDFPNALGNQGNFFFGADTDDEKCIKIMEIKEAFASDSDLYYRFYFGEEGVDYADENGYFLRLNQDADARSAAGVGYWWAMQPKSFEEYNREVMAEYVESHTVAQANPPVYSGRNFYISGENVSATRYGADVSTVSNEYYNQVLMGLADVDATWDSYIASLYGAGLDKILAEYEAMLSGE